MIIVLFSYGAIHDKHAVLEYEWHCAGVDGFVQVGVRGRRWMRVWARICLIHCSLWSTVASGATSDSRIGVVFPTDHICVVFLHGWFQIVDGT